MPAPISSATLSEIRRHHLALRAVCRKCRRLAELDLKLLIDLFGEDFDVAAPDDPLVQRLRCEVCGTSDVDLWVEEEDLFGASQMATGWNKR